MPPSPPAPVVPTSLLRAIELLSEARAIIRDNAPGYAVWLEEARAALAEMQPDADLEAGYRKGLEAAASLCIAHFDRALVEVPDPPDTPEDLDPAIERALVQAGRELAWSNLRRELELLKAAPMPKDSA